MKLVFIGRTVIFLFLTGFFFLSNLYAEEELNGSLENGTIENEATEISNDISKDKTSKNVNIDMLVLYGMYNYVLSTANISYNDENFVSFLSTDLKRSNDFGYGDTPLTDDTVYANSSYYENRIGLTINYNHSDTSKWILDGEANNDSRGMFESDLYTHSGKEQIYNREEKDKVKGNVKYINRLLSQSIEWYLNLGGAQYVHRLIGDASEDTANTRNDSARSRVNQINPEIGGEWVLAASNRIRFKLGYLYYDYLQEDESDDWHFQCESIYDMKLPLNILFSIGVKYDYNKDRKPPYTIKKPQDFFKGIFKDYFIVGVSYKGIKNLSAEFLYRYDIVPFQPEEFYLEQKFIKPTYDLPPSEVRHSDMKLDYKANSLFSFKGTFKYEKVDNYYNYYPVAGNVLSADTTSVNFYNTGLDTKFNIYQKMIEVTLGYMYSYYDSDVNITYHSNHNLSSLLKYNTEKFGLEWGHKLVGDVHTNPEEDEKIPISVIGHLGLQLQVLEGFYSYFKVDNLYNNRYTLRQGYPEPGISLMGGLRILI